jgi:hypothetical protein
MVRSVDFFFAVRTPVHRKKSEVSEIKTLQDYFTKCIYSFVDKVEVIDFSEKPDYDGLGRVLIKAQHVMVEIDSLMSESTPTQIEEAEFYTSPNLYDINCTREEMLVNVPYDTLKFNK